MPSTRFEPCPPTAALSTFGCWRSEALRGVLDGGCNRARRHHQVPARGSQDPSDLLRFGRFLPVLLFDFLGLDLPGLLENLVVQVLDDVELIEDDLRFGQELLHYGGIGGIHVARHGINLITEAFVHEHLKNGLDRLLCFAFDNRKDLAGIVVPCEWLFRR